MCSLPYNKTRLYVKTEAGFANKMIQVNFLKEILVKLAIKHKASSGAIGKNIAKVKRRSKRFWLSSQ